MKLVALMRVHIFYLICLDRRYKIAIFFFKKFIEQPSLLKLDRVTHSYNANVRETEAGGLPGPHTELPDSLDYRMRPCHKT